MHMAWVKAVCGRLESRFRYSKDIVYNNFPWPEMSDKQTLKLEGLGNAILAARALYPNATPAALYEPTSMPAELRNAHRALDRAVDRLYRKEAFASDRERVEHLFEMYAKLTVPLAPEPATVGPKRGRKAKSATG